MRVAVVMRMVVIVLMVMVVVVGAYTHRFLSGQPASAFVTHQSISKEASSISRPARSSPLRRWQSGHSANMSSD